MPVVTHESWHSIYARYASNADGAAKPIVASNSAAEIGINSIGGLLGAGERQWQWLKGSSGRKQCCIGVAIGVLRYEVSI